MRQATVRTSLLALATATLASLTLAGGAAALGDCSPQPKVKVLYSGEGKLESVAVDRRGSVYFTDATAGRLLKLRDGGRPPRVLASGIDGPGGIVFGRPGKVLVGFGDSIAQASDGILSPDAGIYSVDARTGSRTTFVDGLQMANGITRGDGAIFASTDVGTGIDRVEGGKVELEWATLTSPNGLIADATGRSLFAAETFTTPTVMRVPFDDPGAAKPYYSNTDPADAAAGLDGLTRGDGNTLYAAANGAGEVWRIDGPHSACVLVHRIPFPSGPSNVAFGRGHGIPRTSLLVTTFGGELLQVRKAR